MSTDRILSEILGSGAATGFAGGLAGGLASGLLTSRSGRKFAKNALKVGGIAAVGGLAYAAWSRYRLNQDLSVAGASGARLSPTPALEQFVPRSPGDRDALGRVLLQAMIAAARADGRLDGRERQAILAHVERLQISETERAELLSWLDRPVDMSELVAAAATPEMAAEIYTASLLAIDLDEPAERAYLAMLAARLGLPETLVASIHREIDADAAASAPAPALQGALA